MVTSWIFSLKEVCLKKIQVKIIYTPLLYRLSVLLVFLTVGGGDGVSTEVYLTFCGACRFCRLFFQSPDALHLMHNMEMIAESKLNVIDLSTFPLHLLELCEICQLIVWDNVWSVLRLNSAIVDILFKQFGYCLRLHPT